MPFFSAAPQWSPHTNLSGLLFCADWTRTAYQDAARATSAAAVSDVVYWWGGLNAQAADATRPTLAAGPSSGRLVPSWDGTNARALTVGGSFLNGSRITIACVYKATNTGAESDLVGRGGYSEHGFRLFVSAGGALTFGVNTGGGLVSCTQGTRVDDDTWRVAAGTYNGTTARLLDRGQTASSGAQSGVVTYAGADTAFWVGGASADGTASAFYKAKTIALVLATADTFDSDALLTQLVNNLAAYAGVP